MTELEVILATKAVLVIENGTCRMLNGSDKDPSTVFVPLPEGGSKTMDEVLHECDGDDLTPRAQLLIASIDAMLDAAYKSGFTNGRRVTKVVGRDSAGRRLGVKMFGKRLQV